MQADHALPTATDVDNVIQLPVPAWRPHGWYAHSVRPGRAHLLVRVPDSKDGRRLSPLCGLPVGVYHPSNRRERCRICEARFSSDDYDTGGAA